MLSILKSPAVSALVLGLAFTNIPAQAQSMTMSPNAIQPETTISISADAQVTAEPDVAYLSGGVTSEAPTAREALQKNASDMAGVYKALKAAGIAEKNIQTSNFSLQPRYIYPQNSERVLQGYTVSNQVTVKVTDLANIGKMIDAMVAQGGNTFNGINFAVEDPSDLQNQARRKAMKEAMARAELYAEVSGYEISRIVTINEGGSYSPSPAPMVRMRAMAADESAPTQISGGEMSYSANVSVVFEMKKR